MSELAEKEPEAAELLAFQLMMHSHCEMPVSTAPGESPLDLWRAEGAEGRAYRDRYRRHAELFLTNLEEVGLRVAKSSSAKVSKRLREIQLIPAKEAYTLEEELRPKSDISPQLPG